MEANATQRLEPPSADEPIQRATEDRLGRAPLARRVAEAILARPHEASIVVGVFGEWGTGKSSILNIALERLEELSETTDTERPPIIIRFNPWTYSQQDQILVAFFQTLSTRLGQKDSSEAARNVAKGLQVYSRALAPVQFGLSLLHPAAGQAVKSARDFLQKGSSAIKEVADLAARDVEAIKGKINELLREQRQLIVVVMDDIDRLSHDEVRQVFQLVKNNADFPYMAYLMAFDEKLVGEALQTVYGPRFLEKIVQVQVQVPVPDRDLMLDVLYEELEKLRLHVGARYTREALLNVFLRGPHEWLRNMRDVRRYLNALNFTLPLVKHEVHIPEFAAVEAVRLFRPKVYAALQTYMRHLLGELGDKPGTAEGEGWFVSFKAACGDEWPSAQSLLEYLLPEVEDAVRGAKVNWSEDAEAGWLRDKRLRSREHFPRYFQFAVNPSALSEVEFQSTLVDIADHRALREHVTRLLEAGRLAQWLRRVHAHAAEITNPSRAALSLLSIADLTEPRVTMTTLVAAVDRLLQREAPDESKLTIMEALHEEYDLETIDRLLSYQFEEAHRPNAMTQKQLTELRDDLLRRLRGQAENGTLPRRAHFPELVWTLFNYDEKDLARKVVDAALTDETALPKVLDTLVGDRYSSQPDSMFSHWSPYLSENASKLIDFKNLRNRLGSLSREYVQSLDERHQTILRYLVDLDEEKTPEKKETPDTES